MPSVTFVLSQPLQLTVAVEPFFSFTMGPALLLAALLYDAVLLLLAVALYRRMRARRHALRAAAAHLPVLAIRNAPPAAVALPLG